MKAAIATLAVLALAVLTTLALYQGGRWWTAVRLRHGTAPLRYRAEWTRLQDERRRLLNHLREIQFDYDTGKLDLTDYTTLHTRYEREALAVLAAIDAMRRGERDGRLA